MSYKYTILQPIYDIDVQSPKEGRIGYESWVAPQRIQGVPKDVYGYVEYGNQLSTEIARKYTLESIQQKEFTR